MNIALHSHQEFEHYIFHYHYNEHRMLHKDGTTGCSTAELPFRTKTEDLSFSWFADRHH